MSVPRGRVAARMLTSVHSIAPTRGRRGCPTAAADVAASGAGKAMIELLVPVDGSKPAERAVRHAIKLVAGGLKARILLLNVQPELPRTRSRAEKRSDMLRQLEAADEAMHSAASLLGRASVTWERCLRNGAAADTILELARERHCAAIVMGTRGLGAVAGLVLGSVAAKIVQLAPVPVTLVK